MSGRCQIYGKFVSDSPAPAGLSVSELDADAAGAAAGLSADEISDRMGGGGACYSISRDGKRICTFWLSRGGSYVYGGRRHRLDARAACAHGFSPQIPEIPAGELVAALNALLLRVGASRMLVSCAEGWPAGELSGAGLYPVGQSPAAGGVFTMNPQHGPRGRGVRFAFRRLFPSLSAWLFSIMQKAASKQFLLSGYVSGTRLKARFFGPEQYARFYSGLLFESNSAPEAESSPSRAKRDDGQPGISLRVCPKGEIRKSEGAIAIPIMVRSLIGISRPFEEFSELLPESAQNDMKKIEKAGFSQEMSHDPLDLLLFYKSMYLPMLGVRHASRSVVVGYEEAEAHFMQGFLLFVKKGIALQGAALLAKCGGRLVMKILGVSEGSFSITRSGVNSALVYFSLRHAFSSGFRVMDFGLSGPFRSDGVLAFKRKWGTTEFADRGNPVVCAAFCDEKAKREFLGRYRPYLMDEIEETDAPVIP